jgi:hypothetical protein
MEKEQRDKYGFPVTSSFGLGLQIISMAHEMAQPFQLVRNR